MSTVKINTIIAYEGVPMKNDQGTFRFGDDGALLLSCGKVLGAVRYEEENFDTARVEVTNRWKGDGSGKVPHVVYKKASDASAQDLKEAISKMVVFVEVE